jgi:hypothetical protein
MADDIRAFIKEHDADLKAKPESEAVSQAYTNLCGMRPGQHAPRELNLTLNTVVSAALACMASRPCAPRLKFRCPTAAFVKT